MTGEFGDGAEVVDGFLSKIVPMRLPIISSGLGNEDVTVGVWP